MQAYSNPDRETDPHALPNIEVFYVYRGYTMGQPMVDSDYRPLDDGWYWHPRFPGCMPDCEPFGPFDTEAEALADAQDNN